MVRCTRWLIPTILLAWTPTGWAQPTAGEPEPPPFHLPEGVRIDRDLDYGGKGNPRQSLDLLRPEKPRDGKPLPVVVIIHGGAFRAGDKAMGLREAADLARTGDYAAATINYRLSGEATWPAQIHDCKAAVRWIRASAAKYGLDPDRIGVMGASAGGHLAAMLGVAGDVGALEGDVGPHTGVGSRVACVVDQFGPADLLSMGDFPGRIDHNAADSPESRLIGGPLPRNREKARSASPVTYASRDDAPFLILHGDQDPLVPYQQSERLAEALKQAGVPCVFVKVTDGGHGRFRRPEVARRIRQFLDKHLLDRPVGEVSDLPIPRPGGPAKARTRPAPNAKAAPQPRR